MQPRLRNLITPGQIRRRALHELKVKVDQEAERKKQDPNYRSKPMSINDAKDPRWEAWIQARCKDMRAQGRLVTDQQLRDLTASRKLREGDKARFVGETRIEETSTGKHVERPEGQEGVIVKAMVGEDNVWCFWFRPKAPVGAEELEGTIELAEFFFKENTRGYLEIERIP